MSDDELAKFLKNLSKTLDKLGDLPKLKYPELSSEMNDLLWCLDGIDECNERINNGTKNVEYYLNAIEERRIKIKNQWLYILN